MTHSNMTAKEHQMLEIEKNDAPESRKDKMVSRYEQVVQSWAGGDSIRISN